MIISVITSIVCYICYAIIEALYKWYKEYKRRNRIITDEEIQQHDDKMKVLQEYGVFIGRPIDKKAPIVYADLEDDDDYESEWDYPADETVLQGDQTVL